MAFGYVAEEPLERVTSEDLVAYETIVTTRQLLA